MANALEMMQEFESIVSGFADSLFIFKDFLSDRKKEKKSFKISALLMDYFPEASIESLHDAQEDVKVLQKLSEKLINDNLIKKNAKSISQLSYEQTVKNNNDLCKVSLQDYKSKLSSNMIEKLSKAGISKSILVETYEKKGEEGMKYLLSQNVNGKPRVTSQKKTLNKIINILKV